MEIFRSKEIQQVRKWKIKKRTIVNITATVSAYTGKDSKTNITPVEASSSLCLVGYSWRKEIM